MSSVLGQYESLRRKNASWRRGLPPHTRAVEKNASIYHEHPLDIFGSQDAIRLLYLRPGAPSTFISHHEPGLVDARLVTTRLDETPAFTALSYSWGPQNDLVEICIEEETGEFQFLFLVSRHLEYALRNLRHPYREVIVWVDAICINQADLDERSKQVAIMADIYRAATHVTIWMGMPKQSPIVLEERRRATTENVYPGYGRQSRGISDQHSTLDPEDDLRDGLDMINVSRNRIKNCEECDRTMNVKVWTTTSAGHEESIWMDASDAIHLTSARSLAWWNRLWCLQELLLSRVYPKVMFGHHIFRWLDFAELMRCWAPDPECSRCLRGTFQQLDVLEQVDRFGSMQRLYAEYRRGKDNAIFKTGPVQTTTREVLDGVQSFLQLLGSTSELNATVEADRVYAILGLLNPTIRQWVPVNYQTPLSKLYQSIISALLTGSDLRTAAEVLVDLLRWPRADKDAPSWVRDLNATASDRQDITLFRDLWAPHSDDRKRSEHCMYHFVEEDSDTEWTHFESPVLSWSVMFLGTVESLLIVDKVGNIERRKDSDDPSLLRTRGGVWTDTQQRAVQSIVHQLQYTTTRRIDTFSFFVTSFGYTGATWNWEPTYGDVVAYMRFTRQTCILRPRAQKVPTGHSISKSQTVSSATSKQAQPSITFAEQAVSDIDTEQKSTTQRIEVHTTYELHVPCLIDNSVCSCATHPHSQRDFELITIT